MQKELEAFYQALREDKIKLDEIELAEVVWLARQIESQQHQSSLIEMFKKRLQSIIDSFKNLLPQEAKREQEPKSHIETKAQTEQYTGKQKRAIKKHSESAPLIASENESQSSLPFRTPVNRYLHNDNAWIYAFRHFKQKKPTGSSVIFDEERSADYIASNKLFVPQYKASYEKRFEVVFVVDISDSMEIWEEWIDEFFKSVKNYGIFKSFTIYFMQSDKNFRLYKSKEKRVELNQQWHRKFTADTLCFVLTDMLSTGWHSGAWLSHFDQWQKNFPLSIVQMLPYHLWRGTIINHATLTQLEGQKIIGKNRYLKSKARVRNPNEHLLKLPLLTLEAEAFDAYGKVLLVKGENRIDGAVFKLDKVYGERIIATDQDKTDEERVEHFYNIASEPAKRLAEYLSVVPLTFHVMKIVQELFVPNATQVHLSELFMSGLINKEHKRGKIYSFYDTNCSQESVREILLNLLGVSKAVKTIVRISEFVSKGEGAFDFLAFLQDPDYLAKGKVSNEFDREFARISATLLEKMGGEYARKANELTEYIEYEEEELEEEINIITPPSKRFQMGSTEREEEQPIHEVIINYDFEIASTPVTVGEFRAFVEDSGYVTEAEQKNDSGAGIWNAEKEEWGWKEDANWKNPYFEQTDDHPVVCVSWNDAQAYIKWLNEKTGETYRLPSETEWEFSCRAGSTTKWHFGDNESELEKYAWYGRKDGDSTKPVGIKEPNQWGLYDMHGNVWEWCLDDWAENYNETPIDGSANHSQNKETKKVLRGGSWSLSADWSRSANRSWYSPDLRYVSWGFRLLRTI